jgi:hypothetical protein
MSQSASVRFMHKQGKGQSYVYGEKAVERSGKKITVNKTIQFTNFECVTSDPEQIEYLRNHSEHVKNGGAFLYEVSAEDEADLGLIQKMKAAIQNRQKGLPAEEVKLPKKSEEGKDREEVDVVRNPKSKSTVVVK